MSATTGPSNPSRTRLFWLVALAATLLVSVAFGYLHIFSYFADYDDGGTMILATQYFLDGQVFYDEMETSYGPAYFALKWFLHGPPLGIPLTHDAVLFTALACWTCAAVILGLAVWGMTGRPGLALLSYLAAYLHLSTIANEPGHPQELLGIILAALPALACLGARGRLPWPALVMGGLSAAAVLTKVNVGLFVTVSATAALLASVHAMPHPARYYTKAKRKRGRQVLSSLALRVSVVSGWGRFWRTTTTVSYGVIGMGAMALPFYLMKSQLAEPWVLRYAAIIGAATLPVWLLAWFDATGDRGGHDSARSKPLPAGPGTREFIAFTIAGLATTACLIALVATRGTTLWGLLHSLVIRPGQIYTTGQWSWPTPTSVWSPVICLASVVLAVCHLRRHGYRRPTREHLGTLISVLKAAIAVWTFYVVSKWRVHPFPLFSFALPWTWLVLVVPEDARDISREAARKIIDRSRFPRVLLALLCVLQPLQTYPVAGSQAFFGSLLLIPMAAVLLHDAVAGLGHRWTILRLLPVAAATPVVIAVFSNTLVVGRMYREGVPLGLDGTSRWRLEERRVATYEFLVRNLTDHADTFLSNIGFNSLYLWTDLRPPSSRSLLPHAPEVLPVAQQREIISRLKRSPRSCVVLHPLLFPFLSGRSELDDYLASAFKTVGRVGRYRFGVIRERSEIELTDCAVWRPRLSPVGREKTAGREETATAELRLWATEEHTIGRLVIQDLDTGKTVGDTHASETEARCTVVDERGNPIALGPGAEEGVAWARPRRLILRLDRSEAVREGHFLVVRLYDVAGRWIKSVPFVETTDLAFACPLPVP